jgi:hypothetical protein
VVNSTRGSIVRHAAMNSRMNPAALHAAAGPPVLPSTPQLEGRAILWTMELHRWLCWTSEGGNAPAFVRTVGEAARMACLPEYELLRPVLLELKRRYPEPEPGKPPNFTPKHDAPR